MLSDILPTGFECGVLNGKVTPGSMIAIVGAGPIGLAALLTAQFYSPAEVIMVDLDDNRLEIARRFGATKTINASGSQATEVDLHLERLWSQNITITTRLVDTVTTPMLLKTVEAHKIDPTKLITHRFKLDKILDAYDVFSRAAETRALKVIVEA